MPTATRSTRQEQRELTGKLRAERKMWPEVAAEFCDRYGVNVRAALRMARDWSQRDAADEWNKRWPNDPKTFKNFSYWELWPGPTGHAPSLEVLGRLADLYECSAADLVSDVADFRTRDIAYRDNKQLAQLQSMIQPAAPSDLHALIARLEQMDVNELARLTTSWSDRLGTTSSRRALLLKLSAGLSLAAASPALADEQVSDAPVEVVHDAHFEGIWHSRYIYPSTSRGKEFVGEHHMVFRQNGSRLMGQSLPHTTGSRLRIELAAEPPVATGTWRETTSPDGYYRGAAYHGTLQLVIDPSGRKMRGMWLGFAKDFQINSGQWELTWQEGSTSKTVQRRYHDKV
ncbi:MAG: hypothetical protein GEU86_19835 [Actinophytocola sp.]|nr:hypothetical protein [Actinophytocola sp.]